MKVDLKNLFLSVCIILIFISCKKETEKGNIKITFAHNVDAKPLQKDTFLYVNAAGNPYMVSEVKYFISEVKLHNFEGDYFYVTENNGIHYVEDALPETMIWDIKETIPAGTYDSVIFVFGINKEKNVKGLFVNPPEVNMAWPEILGGGYHYLQLNGKWKDTLNKVNSLMFHLGIGQTYKPGSMHNTDSITGYVQNYFFVRLPLKGFSIKNGDEKQIQLTMNIEKWFEAPNVFDLNFYGKMIMQNQMAMHMMSQNGAYVFSVNFSK